MEAIRGVRLRKFKLRKIVLGVRMHFRHMYTHKNCQFGKREFSGIFPLAGGDFVISKREFPVALPSAFRHCRSRVTRVRYWLELCDTWNWSDDKDTVSGIAILDTTAIPEMRSAILMSFRIRQSQYAVYSQTVAVITRSPATAGIANRPLLFLEHRIPMPELFTVRRFTRVLEAGKYGCPY